MTDPLLSVPIGADAAFPKTEFDRRIDNLQRVLREQGVDLFLSSGPENIFYLTGQQTPGFYMFQCVCVPAEGAPFLFMRALESYNARSNCFIEDISGYIDGESPGAGLASLLVDRGWAKKRVAIDRNAWFLTVNIYEDIASDVPGLVDGSNLVEPLRRVKSGLELDAIAQAAAANDAGMRAGLAAVKADATENDVAAEILRASVRAGGEYLGMEPFVASGPRSGLPHATWRRRRIEPGDVVILETAGCYNRYHSALFRTVAVGEPPAGVRENYGVCVAALETGMAAIKPGASCAQVHNTVQAVIDDHGKTDMYRKKTGYSMGISFAPDWGEHGVLGLHHNIDVALEPGMVFHVPITLRDFGRYTVAVSETVAVTESGSRPLNDLSRDLVAA